MEKASFLTSFPHLRQHNITWFITSGTLIGSYRHHDLVPWDTDVDVAVSRHAKATLKPALEGVWGDGHVFVVSFHNPFQTFSFTYQSIQFLQSHKKKANG